MDQPELVAIREQNQQRLEWLGKHGVQINGFPEQWKQKLLEHLVGDALPRLQLEFEQYVASVIADAETQANRALLLGQGIIPNGKEPR